MEAPTNSRFMFVVLLALGAGGVGGFLLAKKLMEEHYAEQAQQEIEDVVAYFNNKYRLKEENEIEEEEVSVVVSQRHVKPDILSLSIAPTVVLSEEGDEDFPYEEDEEIFTETYEEEEEEVTQYEVREEPYLITYDELMADDRDEYENIDLFYYRFDGVLCDAADQILEDPEDIIGWEWQKVLETQTTAFVRNDILQNNYEIHSFSKSYKEDVAGRQETERERHFRQMARTKEVMDTFATEFPPAELINNSEIEEVPLKRKEPYVRPQHQKTRYDLIGKEEDEE